MIDIKKLSQEAIRKGIPESWFEKLYSQSEGDPQHVPWADLKPNPFLVQWLRGQSKLIGKALVVGCGLGDDAEEISKCGFSTTSFDVSPTAINWCKERFPHSAVNYHAKNLFSSPSTWMKSFDFVFEAYTIQALPRDLREKSIKAVANFVAPQGTLLVVCSGLEKNHRREGPPWPLSNEELDLFLKSGLKKKSVNQQVDNQSPIPTTMIAEFNRV